MTNGFLSFADGLALGLLTVFMVESILGFRMPAPLAPKQEVPRAF